MNRLPTFFVTLTPVLLLQPDRGVVNAIFSVVLTNFFLMLAIYRII